MSDPVLNQLVHRIGFQHNTPPVALWLCRGNWHLWFSVRDQQLPYEQWQGTYLNLDNMGGITRVTVYDDGHEEIMVIK